MKGERFTGQGSAKSGHLHGGQGDWGGVQDASKNIPPNSKFLSVIGKNQETCLIGSYILSGNLIFRFVSPWAP